jgi:hypothetical protein
VGPVRVDIATAAAFLDVQPLELTAGIYAGLADGEPAAYAFIADTLENGAGFSSHLGEDTVLPELLSRIGVYLRELEEPGHAHECAASCYRCLRDYGNMAYHALLDWRLARDLFAVLSGDDLHVDTAAEASALGRWAASYGATLLDGAPATAAVFDNPLRGRFVVIARHPLEASEPALIAPRLAAARTYRRVIEMCDEAEPLL